MLIIYWGIKAISTKKLESNIIKAGIGGVILSLPWWLFKFKESILYRTGTPEITQSTTLLAKFKGLFAPLAILDPAGGTATRAYTFKDFFIARSYGGINVHIGWGIVITLLVIVGFVFLLKNYKKEKVWIPITLAWFVFTFLGTNSMTFNLPIGFVGFRFWILLSIPVAIIATEGLWGIFEYCKKYNIPQIAVLFIIIVGVFATSGYQKYYQNYKAFWPPGVRFSSMDEVYGYTWFKTLPPNTKVFGFCSHISSIHLTGFDMLDPMWKDEVINFREGIIDKEFGELYYFLDNNEYEYLVVDSYCIRNFGINRTNTLINELAITNVFQLAYQSPNVFVYKVLR